ncbi:MAG TPA: prolyl oligopeptidase family serine peptidase [Caulobacteraceae bacterium]
MSGLDRRALLAGAGALSAVLAARVARAAAPVPPAPIARVEVVKDTYFGETLSDPYRWMENSKDPDWLPFLKGQNDHTRAILDTIPGRGALLTRIQSLSGDTVLTSRVQRAGGKLFYQQRPAGADNYKLFVREAGADRVLIDPTKLSAATGHVSLDWWRASPDGAHVVYGLSKDGSEDSVLHILAVAGGADLPERIANTETASPQWLDDGSGFFYNQLTAPVATPERYLDSQARFHRLGADPAADPILMKRGLHADVVYDKIQSPIIFTGRGSRHAVLILADVRPESRLFVAPVADAVAGKAVWTPVAGFEDEVTDFDLNGDDLYLLANKGTPRGRVLKTSASATSLASASEVVPQGPIVIEGISRARDGLYLKMMDGGVSRLRKLGPDGKVADVNLPFDGTIGAVFAEPEEDGALISYTGWLSPAGIWSVSAGGKVADTGLTPRPAIDVSPYETVRGFAAAKDGVKIPYSLIYKKGLKLDGKTPAWISAYGSYGAAAYTPAFAGRTLALIDAGFIVGYANVRGGGEYGREWHKAGQLANKPNTWRDLIAVCEALCAKGYTAPSRLAIGGRSAGGITMGRAMTERPDLFAAVIDGVGWSNPLRYVVEQDGYGEEPEWGAIAEKSGYEALKSIDSYQHVQDGTPYPAVLLTTGVTDPRVAPFHVAKMTARLQAATSSGKPILLRVDYDAGHGIGSTRAQQDREAADTYAFLLWRTGAAAYQPT